VFTRELRADEGPSVLVAGVALGVVDEGLKRLVLEIEGLPTLA
jgi:hypothetical protein